MLLETHMLQLALPRPCHHHTRPHHNPPLDLPSELQVTIRFQKEHVEATGLQRQKRAVPVQNKAVLSELRLT